MTKLIKGEAYILRTCSADMTSHGGFVWPKSGMVEAPDWSEDSKCGGGLHGFLCGEGAGYIADWFPRAVWIVAKVAEWVDLVGKVKFPRAEVVFCGSRLDATNKIIELGAKGAVIGASVNSGDRGTSISGYRGTSTSGDYGVSTSGKYGTSTSGDYGVSTSGKYGTSTSGEGGTIMIKYCDCGRDRVKVGYIGGDGLKPNTPYKIIDGEFVEVEQ